MDRLANHTRGPISERSHRQGAPCRRDAGGPTQGFLICPRTEAGGRGCEKPVAPTHIGGAGTGKCNGSASIDLLLANKPIAFAVARDSGAGRNRAVARSRPT
jgi:hypothetical protein